jgi:hypothetical protein
MNALQNFQVESDELKSDLNKYVRVISEAYKDS